MALILRFFAKFDSFIGLCHSGWR